MDYIKSSIDLNTAAILAKIENVGYEWREIPPIINSVHNVYGSPRNCVPHFWSELTPLIIKLEELTDGLFPTKSWFLVMVKGSYTDEHTHPNAQKYVCSYYPRITSEHSMLELYIDNEWRTIPLQSGDFVLFKKDILHRVQTQTVDDKRFNIGFNL